MIIAQSINMSIMLAGLKAVRQRRRTRSTSRLRNGNEDDDDLGFDTSQFIAKHNEGDLCPEDESPMISTQHRKKWMDQDGGAGKQRQSSNGKGAIANNTNNRLHNDINISYNSHGTATTAASTAINTTISSQNEYCWDETIGNEDVEENDEVITAGNEALLFIYGHNVNLYTDVFQLPSHLNEVQSLLLLKHIDRSYKEQMHYLNHTDLSVAMAYFRRHHNNNNNKLNDKYAQVVNTMDPRTFLDIQKDALHRAYTILMHDESRNEYDELLRLHRQDMLEEEEDEDVGACVDEDVVVAPSESAKFEEEEEETYSDDDSGILTVQTSADEEDDYEDENYEDEDEGRIRSKANQRSVTGTPQKQPLRNQQQQQYSPTDPLEFDMLVHDSLADEDYFSQLHRNAKIRGTEENTKMTVGKEDVLFFDPFNLQGDDLISNEHDGRRALFPEKAVASNEYEEDEYEEKEDENTNDSTTMFVCSLPSSGEEDEDDEVTMGRLIELQEKAAKKKMSSLYLDDVLKSSSSDGTDSEDDDYEECDEAEVNDDENTAQVGNEGIVANHTIDDGSVVTKTKNYFLDDDSTLVTLPKQTSNDWAASVVTNTESTSSCASSRSSSAPGKENARTKKRKGLKAKVRNLVKTIGSKSRPSTPSSVVVDGDKFPEQEVYGSSNNSIGSRSNRAAASSLRPRMIESSSFDPDGRNLSDTSYDTTSSVSEEDEEAEIENLLSIASTFSAMDAAALIAERVRTRKSSTQNDVFHDEDGSIDCFSTDDDNTISRNRNRRGCRKLSRFEADDEMILKEEEDDDDDYDEEEYSQCAEGHGWSSSPPSSASRGIFATCIDGVGSSIDNTLDSVERVFAC